MFLSHFAAGMVGSRVEPRLRLGTAFVAAQLPDAIWPVLLLTGTEHATIAPGDTAVTPLRFDHYPWSHSLLTVVLWGVLLGLLVRWRAGSRRAGVVAGLLVVSHWLLDFASHRPDVPLMPGAGPKVGLGLWWSIPATLLVEGALFAAAVAFYTRGRRVGWGFRLLVATLVAIYLANVFGPPPPGLTAVAISGIVAVPLFWFWANRAEAR